MAFSPMPSVALLKTLAAQDTIGGYSHAVASNPTVQLSYIYCPNIYLY